MGKYSIKELERLSGIKAHTIRIWEKRHNLVHPQRTPTNIRFYSDDDLRKIINVSMLNNHGVKISKIANMSAEEINREILTINAVQTDASAYVEQLVMAMVALHEEAFDQALRTLVARFGFERAITEAIYPFLEKIGILWQTKNISPAQEHFISNLIRQKIIVAIDSLPLPMQATRSFMLFLPEHELHEIGLLFNYYLVKHAGYKVFYLGQNVPYNDLVEVIGTHNPDVLVTSIISPITGDSLAYLDKLSKQFPTQRILVSGLQVTSLPTDAWQNVEIFSNALKFKELIS